MPQLYAVSTTMNSLADAETNLTISAVMRHIYRDDGADYRLEPRMITNLTDDDNNPLPDAQDSTSTGLLIFEVHFKSPHGVWSNSRIQAYGSDEDSAEEEFLTDSYKYSRYQNGRWIILAMEEWEAEQARNLEQDDD